MVLFQLELFRKRRDLLPSSGFLFYHDKIEAVESDIKNNDGIDCWVEAIH